MEWHTGNTLSQSVFTLLFVHQLADINPDLLPPEISLKKDALRPIELITVVLRSAVFGLLKSCDMVWRELAKKRVQDVSIPSCPQRARMALTMSGGGLAKRQMRCHSAGGCPHRCRPPQIGRRVCMGETLHNIAFRARHAL